MIKQKTILVGGFVSLVGVCSVSLANRFTDWSKLLRSLTLFVMRLKALR